MSRNAVSGQQLEEDVRSACGELGRRLRAGEQCTAEEFLEQLPQVAARSELALELIYTEFVVREELGQTVTSEDWLVRFPQWQQDLRQLFEVHLQVCSGETSRSSLGKDRRPSDPGNATQRVVNRSEHSAGRGAAELGEGRLVGNYELLEELGRGGMGVVYRARQMNLNRSVALKMILSGAYASAREITRFQMEAEAAARLQHPHIVQIHEVGAHDRRPFLSMELVEGGSLETMLKGPRPAPRDAATLLATIARAVAFAHRHGVVHRDLKPANVLLTRDGVAKIADFGLAKQVLEGDQEYTRSGAIVGTPSYMAPEQAKGTPAEVGPATDVYALGAILYEMLTGRAPFVAETPLVTLRLVLTEEPIPLSRLRSSVPRDLETICLKCLEKKPSDRYASADEFADDLQRFLSGEPIRAKSVSPLERFVKWTRRRPALALFIASLIVSLAAVSALWRRADVAAARAERSRVAADRLRMAAEKSRAAAELAQQNSDRQKQYAELQRQRAERNAYFHRVGQAFGEWQGNQVERANQLLDECAPELRQWEWSYIKSLSNAQLTTMRGHTESVWCVAFSPDSKTIASGSGLWGWGRPGEVILWDADTGACRAVLRDHKGPIMSVAFSPDGQKIASASQGWDGEKSAGVKVWNLAGEELFSLAQPGDNGFVVQFTRDGRRLATGDINGFVRFWDAENGAPLEPSFRAHNSIVFDLSFSPHDNQFATVGRDGSLRIWDQDTGSETHPPLTGYKDLRHVKFSPDGCHVAFSNWGRELRVWDLASDPPDIKEYSYDMGLINSFAFSPEGRRLALAGRDGTVLIVEAATGKTLKRLHTHNGAVRDLAFRPDGCVLATGGIDRCLKTWDARTDWNDEHFFVGAKVISGYFYRMAITPDGQRLLLPSGFNRGTAGRGEKALLIWNLEQARVERTLRGHTGWLTDVDVTRDGKYYATASEDKTARLWDATGADESRKFVGHSAPVTGVAFLPHGFRLATSSADGTVRLWDCATAAELNVLRGHQGSVTDVALDSQGRRLASAGSDQSIRIWDANTGAVLRTLLGHTAAVTSIEFSDDDRLLASASEDETVRIWDLASGQQLTMCRGHSGTVRHVSFAPGGQRLVSGGQDMSLRVWDVSSGEEVLTLRGTYEIAAAKFHPDAQRLIAVHDATVRVWNARPQPSAHLAEAFQNANITWHGVEGRRCRSAGLSAAVEFHRQCLTRYQPENHDAFTARGTAFANLGSWQDAADDFAAAMDRGADTLYELSDHLLLQLYLGNDDQYRQACQRYLTMVGENAAPDLLNKAVWYSVLGPDAVPQPDHLVRLIEKAIAKADRSQVGGYINTLGAALYRCDRIPEARQALMDSIDRNAGGGYVEDWLFLALVEARAGRGELAREWLDKAQQRLQRTDPKLAKAPWWNDFITRIILREAEGAVADANRTL